MVKAKLPPKLEEGKDDPLIPTLSPRQLEFRRVINTANKADRVRLLTKLLEDTHERRKENMAELTEEVLKLKERQAKGWAWLHDEANKDAPNYDSALATYTQIVDKLRELGVENPEPQETVKEDEARVDQAADLFTKPIT